MLKQRIEQTKLYVNDTVATGWAESSVSGLRARGGFEIAMNWANGKLTTCEIKSILGKPCIVRYGGKTKAYNIAAGRSIKISGAM